MEMRSVIAKNLHRIKKPELIGKNEEQKDNYYNQIKKNGYPGSMLELETFSIWTGFNVRIYNSQKTLIKEFNKECQEGKWIIYIINKKYFCFQS